MTPLSWTFRDWLRAMLVFIVGLLLGMAIWWVSPSVTGTTEPWAAESRYYVWALIGAGFFATLFLPKAFWIAPIAICVGQLLYGWNFYQPDGQILWLVGIATAAFYSLASLLGAVSSAILIGILRIAFGVLGAIFGPFKQKTVGP